VRLPRDLSGVALVKALGRLGYYVTRQNGSHARLTHEGSPQHHITIPMHDELRIGTLASILDDVAAAQKMTRDALLQKIL
jgi:predicted RNA binding protein YcfA (HicA-like mRNA interferase family)